MVAQTSIGSFWESSQKISFNSTLDVRSYSSHYNAHFKKANSREPINHGLKFAWEKGRRVYLIKIVSATKKRLR